MRPWRRQRSAPAFSCNTVNWQLFCNDCVSTNMSTIRANHRDKTSSKRYFVINRELADRVPDAHRQEQKHLCLRVCFLWQEVWQKTLLYIWIWFGHAAKIKMTGGSQTRFISLLKSNPTKVVQKKLNTWQNNFLQFARDASAMCRVVNSLVLDIWITTQTSDLSGDSNTSGAQWRLFPWLETQSDVCGAGFRLGVSTSYL